MRYIWLILFICVPLQATTYYLDDVNGDNGDNGSTPDLAWETLDHAIDTVVSGDTVYLASGDYGRFRNVNSIYTDWVTYDACDGQDPCFSCPDASTSALKLEGWSNVIQNKYHHFKHIEIRTDFVMNEDRRVCRLYLAANIIIEDCNLIGGGYVEVPKLESEIIWLRLVNDINIVNCNFLGEGTSDPNRKGCFSAIASTDQADVCDILIDNCDITNCGRGIQAQGFNWTISNNTIHDLTWEAIWCESLVDSNVVDNHIYNIVELPGTGAHADGIKLGIKTGGEITRNINILRNKIHDSDRQLLFFNSSGPIMTNIMVRNNLCYRGSLKSAPAAQVIKCSEFSFINNTFTNAIWFRNDVDTDSLIIQNNDINHIDLKGPDSDPNWYDEVPGEDFNIINLWLGSTPGSYTPGANSVEYQNNIYFAALFEDSDTNDFTLASDSNAIDFGSSVYAPLVDIDSNDRDGSPDNGAYEDPNGKSVEPNNPAPNPPTWASVPAADGNNAISMVATTSTDPNVPIEYFFQETSGNPGATDSGWQVSDANYTDSGLDGNTTYTYRIQYRNVLGITSEWSDANSATATDVIAPTPNPPTWASVPAASSSSSIVMTATTGVEDGSTVEYNFTETSGNPGGDGSGWQASASYTDTGLTKSTTYTYRVQMRDSVPNTGTASSSKSATTFAQASGYRVGYRARYGFE